MQRKTLYRILHLNHFTPRIRMPYRIIPRLLLLVILRAYPGAQVMSILIVVFYSSLLLS